MYEEIKFENQEGFGFICENPVTGSKALVGIFKTREHAAKIAQERMLKHHIMPNWKIVKWGKNVYDSVKYVFHY